ncbi:MAG: glutamate synthase-related protein [Enterobacterales bacterium]|nr:glutamate synthase-related protein [Enterobacterales bacterium]
MAKILVAFGTDKNSKIKQIASGRFGVNASYLASAEVLQIKIAQGAKPGEGGQLPGAKVTLEIADLRHATPGVTLISPPPHHDIYSIEDIAQLIFDLKQVNPKALISVKLVSGPGVGTIAAGVAKAYADMITIAGYDGGTGASPLTSVKYAGTPWEIGLAEAHQALIENNLRDKICLQVDGGLKTGLDVIKGSILGADSFGFGTGPMVALGCKYLRICHLNNCATGIATQNTRLRKHHFKGLPEKVELYFDFIATEVRQWLSRLAVESLDQLIGRTDLLNLLPGNTPQQQKLDLGIILTSAKRPEGSQAHYQQIRNEPHDQGILNRKILGDVKSKMQFAEKDIQLDYGIKNYDRSVGAALSGYIGDQINQYRLNKQNYQTPTINLTFNGIAGQSFGVWNVEGVNMQLTGDANDYVGKGMSGGCISIRSPANINYVPSRGSIIGNTCLYGATGGKLFASGQAGERFAVRNSGSLAVVEGVGDHGCEYMTGGSVLILGPVGENFAAGMTGGLAFVLDIRDTLHKNINPQHVELYSFSDNECDDYTEQLVEMIQQHIEHTDSAWAKKVKRNFDQYIDYFMLVIPKSSVETSPTKSHPISNEGSNRIGVKPSINLRVVN